VIMLVPFAQHLPLARAAWGRLSGWMPRIETNQTLARSLPPARGQEPTAGQIRFDVALDRLQAAQMLRRQSWAGAWVRSDPPGFSLAVASVVQTAHALARAAACVPPSLRDAHWESVRAVLPLAPALAGTPGTRERLLSRVALEWAAAAADPSSDALFALRPSAWIAVQAGGPDALTQQILELAASNGTPALCLDADAGAADVFTAMPAASHFSVAVCDDFEVEAQRTAAALMAYLNEGAQPVALIAQDRALVRRVRALLARQRVPMRDETGWTLSTTRAAAGVRSLLNCVRPDASSDEWLDWLKACGSAGPAGDREAALDALEREWQRAAVRHARNGDIARLGSAARALLHASQQTLLPFRERSQRPLAAWLRLLCAALRDCGLWSRLAADEAGLQVLLALHLEDAALLHAEDTDADALSLVAFGEWMDATLEEATFRPAGDADPQVVITPLASAMLRPFAAVVFPGADDRHLGGPTASSGLLSDAEATAAGVPGREARRSAEALAFAQILRVPRVTFLRRLDDSGDPLSISPLLARLALAASRTSGAGLRAASDLRVSQTRPAAPVARPLPSAPHLLPARLSASACEALRACPYRFFGLKLLRLQSVDELDSEVQKRDYGTWLHAVLHRFHLARTQAGSVDSEARQLHAAADEETHLSGFDAAEFLPYSASFARFVPRYVAWLHARDDGGAQWLDGERELTALPPDWAGVEMHGRLDRVDSVHGADGPLTQLIDYKTGQAAALRSAVKQGEDTQLAFYAALMAAQGEAPGDIAAAYVFLDESERIIELPLPEVQARAELLVEGIGIDLARLRQGAAMPALGEGRSCDFCEARGLCRKDEWSGEELITGEAV
jgi:ATP-dependent helicase/nuclease subunit B